MGRAQQFRMALFSAGVGAALAACAPSADDEAASTAAADNPLLQDWTGPYEAPPFSAISEDHYRPAFDAGAAEWRAELKAIAGTEDAPTFENTLVPLEQAGATLIRVVSVLSNVANTDTTPGLQALDAELWPAFTREVDALFLDDKLYARVQAVYDAREDLAPEDERLAELYHREFVRLGAALEPEAKARLKEINARVAELNTTFAQNLLAETKGFELRVTDEADLAGLSEAMIAAGRAAAETKGYDGEWVFGLNRSVFEAFMTQADSRELRGRLFDGYRLRGANGGETDNSAVVLELVRLRAERAELLGYASHAHYQLETRMAKTPESAVEFLLRVWEPGLARAKEERADMQALAGDDYTVAGHDWWYLSEKVREQRYAFDESALKPYFKLENVLQGAFDMATKLFGVTFEEVDIEAWNPEVVSFDVKGPDGAHLGVFMTDMFARDTKRGGAWMSRYREASDIDGEVVRPIVTNNLNLIPPADGEPALMRFQEVETLFHEFGHGLHGLLTTQKYPFYSGVSGPRDYTEFPAQILEHWASQEEMLADYATHYETGEPIPVELIEKLRSASNHNQGFQTTEFIAAALLDMRWYMLSAEEAAAVTDVRAFEKAVLEEYGLIDEIEPRYRSQYFSHVFSGGYSAGYYAYLWSEILDADGFDAFLEAGDIFDPETAARLKTWVYEAGGKLEADELYRNFRGADPSIEPLLRVRGLAGGEG